MASDDKRLAPELEQALRDDRSALLSDEEKAAIDAWLVSPERMRMAHLNPPTMKPWRKPDGE